ncbi:MAG: GspE/PulE family protein, partial [Syntrophales bacterium]|nr:GspE/PulE family protein [Syntrophales bacterium]
NVVIRILHRKTHLIDLDSLGFSPANRVNYQRVLDQPSGVILVTGPTGSGKTTTLYASLNYLNDGQRAIITVEDPVEYTIEGVVQGQLNTKIGQTHMDFLKSMMRQDPDVIMVGEIRDQIAAEAVIQTALTGHKVLSTFHTEDTTGALLRLMDMGIDTFLISSTVVSVIAQRLIRVLCKRCRRPYLPDQHLLASFNISSMDLKKFTFYEAVGCDDCAGSGFKGRTGIHEFLLVNEDIRDAILARKTSSQIRFVAREKTEFISLREDGFYKATQGITSLDEILRVVFHNEGDTICPRSAEDIVALCEGRKPAAPSGLIPFRVQDTIPLEEEKVLLSLKGTESTLLEGEAYRVRFETSVIEIEIPGILDLFNAYIALMDKMGLVVDPGMAEKFVDIIVHTVKRLEVSMKAEFVEIILRVRQGKVKIEAETLVPQEHFSLPVVASKEKGRRLINFLMPPSGIGHALIAENNLIRKGTPVQKRYSLVNILKEGKSSRMKREDLDGPGAEELEAYLPRGISALYRRHLEEVEVELILI